MKISKHRGKVEIVPETQADLLALSRIIRKGDRVSAETTRSVEIEKGDRKEKVRKKFWLTVEAEETGMVHGRLRIKGKVVSELEFVRKFSYHTLDISESSRLVIHRELLKSEEMFLGRYVEKKEPVIVCILDERECNIYLVGDSVTEIARVSRQGGKMFEQKEDSYFSEILSIVGRHYDGRLVIAGPGFARERLGKEAEKMGFSFVSEGLSHSGRAGLREVFRRKMIERVSRQSRIGEESRLVEEFFRRLSAGKRVAYGRDNVRAAAELGAIETLLISDEYLGDDVVAIVEKTGGKVEIISSRHDDGKRFLEFSGYGAFLRYDIS